jgi:hypothetical protein
MFGASFPAGPLWVRLVASKTRPVPLPPTSDCSAPGFLSSNAGGDEDKLWIGPVIVSSLPMDVSSRDKLNKYEKVRYCSMLQQTQSHSAAGSFLSLKQCCYEHRVSDCTVHPG